MNIDLRLTKREIQALLVQDPEAGTTRVDWPQGKAKTQARLSAEFRLIDALLRAQRNQ